VHGSVCLLCSAETFSHGSQADGTAGPCPANEAVAQVAALSEPARRWCLAHLACDVHGLLLWLSKLDAQSVEFQGGLASPGAPGAQRLLALAAVASRHLRGRWPMPPLCPAALACGEKLRFNPLASARRPGAPEDVLVETRLMRQRPLSAVLAYRRAPEAAAPQLRTLRGLEEAAGAALEGGQADLGCWAEALSGSDLDDLERLRGWRRRTEEALADDPCTLRQLSAAISSRCASVHVAVAFHRQRGAADLAAALLEYLGEGGLEVFMDHHHVMRSVVVGSAALGNAA